MISTILTIYIYIYIILSIFSFISCYYYGYVFLLYVLFSKYYPVIMEYIYNRNSLINISIELHFLELLFIIYVITLEIMILIAIKLTKTITKTITDSTR